MAPADVHAMSRTGSEHRHESDLAPAARMERLDGGRLVRNQRAAELKLMPALADWERIVESTGPGGAGLYGASYVVRGGAAHELYGAQSGMNDDDDDDDEDEEDEEEEEDDETTDDPDCEDNKFSGDEGNNEGDGGDDDDDRGGNDANNDDYD